MICPKCKGRAACMDSRYVEDCRRRRYRCACGEGFSTVEMVVEVQPGRPGLPRKDSNLVNVLRQNLRIEAEKEAKKALRALLK